MENDLEHEPVGWPYSPATKNKSGPHMHHYELPLWICGCGDELRPATA